MLGVLQGTPGYSSALLGVLQGTTGSDREGSSAVRSAAWSLLRSTREYSRVIQVTREIPRSEHSLRWTDGATPHSRRCAAAAPHLDVTQKVDGRGVEVLRLDVRNERLPGRVALDRRELHTGCRSVAAACAAPVGDACGMKHARKVATSAMQRMMMRHGGVAPKPKPPTIHARTRRWGTQGHSRCKRAAFGPRVIRSSQVPQVPLSSVPVQMWQLRDEVWRR